tara:strand:- start:1877 stop:2086 length:210 start_codon:yes stop_codon:yes gene_type:complete
MKNEENKLKDYIEIYWHVDDVLDTRPDLTENQAREVLHEVGRSHDACYGVNWDVIQDTAWLMYPPKKED